MPDPRPIRFTRPELLRSLAPELLRELLEGFPAFVAAAGLDLDALGSNEKRFAACRPLIDELLKNGPTTPTPLVEALFTVSVLAEPEPTEELWHTLTQAGIPIPPDACLADLALTLWLRAPDKARHLYIHRVQLRTRAFETHAAGTFRKTAAMQPVSEALLNQLRQGIELFFIKHHRPAGCLIFHYERGQAHWFIIRHGDRFRRVPTLTSDGRGETAGYYPEVFDVVVVDPVSEQIHIHADGVRTTRMYGAHFGFALYGRENHFEDCVRFNLDPLRELGRGALVCADVPGISWVRLIELNVEHGDKNVVKSSYKSGDVFASLEADEIKLTCRHRLLRAVFSVGFKNAAQPRKVTIKPDNQSNYDHDEDSAVFTSWLDKRGFLLPFLPPKNFQDVAHLAGD
jgi:hypothetical protein